MSTIAFTASRRTSRSGSERYGSSLGIISDPPLLPYSRTALARALASSGACAGAGGWANRKEAARNCHSTNNKIVPNHSSQWGGRPRPRRTPWSGPDDTLKTEADEGVARGLCDEQPGGPPHVTTFSIVLSEQTPR